MTEMLQSIKQWPVLNQVTVEGEQYIIIKHMISARLQHQSTANSSKAACKHLSVARAVYTKTCHYGVHLIAGTDFFFHAMNKVDMNVSMVDTRINDAAAKLPQLLRARAAG